VTDNNPVAHVELGNLAYYRGDLRRAVDEYTSAGNDPHAYSGLGNCLMGGDRKLAIEYYRKALALRPQSSAYITQLANALRVNGDLDEAKQLATAAVKIDPDDPDAREELSRIIAEEAKKKPPP